MALEVYRSKRNFGTTPEPEGRVVKSKTGNLSFVIQKHAASHLHYDFRLELNGVLLSWAVPKGPSLDPNDKRLAMQTEDHPIEYGEFEGVIPPKQYGSGTVMLWDRGTWHPKEDPIAGYRKGKLKFDLNGEKLHGGWTLVRSHGGKYGADKSWLLIKEDDEFARPVTETRIAEDQPNSVVGGRSLAEIAADPDRVWHSNKSVADNVKTGAVKKKKPRLDAAKLKGAVKARIPDFIEPHLAMLVKETPQGDDWVHEMKLDGYRMLSRIEKGECVMYSRNGKDWTGNFSAIARVAARLPVENAWIDGEVVVMETDGRTSFQALQNALSYHDPAKLFYYVFDLPYVNGYDIRKAPLLERKRLLETLLEAPLGMLRLSAHIEGSGAEFFEQACRHKLEGVIAKRADSTYQAGRGRSWLKIKCASRQEMAIGGYTNPEGSRTGFGALLLGVYEPDGTLRYSGKVGTGFNEAALTELHKKLKGLVTAKPPFSNPPRGAEARRAHWVKPELVAEVVFTEWTDDGTLRHASFQGLREDKKARDVVRERAVNAEDATQAAPIVEKRSAEKMAGPRKNRPKRAAAPADTNKGEAYCGIALSNPTKVLYPEAGISKRDLARYYATIGDWILPHLRQRPLTLVRCPNGWKDCFYQKHVDDSVNAVIDRVTIQDSAGPALYMMANSVSAVVALLQMGVLEIHPWGSNATKLGFPDRIVFDLDPADDMGWDKIVEAVHLVRTLLEQLGLTSFVKTTGGKGLHVVVPIDPVVRWDGIKGFTRTIAELLTRTFPDRFTAKISKATRTGKIFIDYLRNAEGSTAISAYSVRARANAPVATPITWHELTKDVRFDHFNVGNVAARLKRLKKDPWAEFFTVRQSITKAMMERVGFTEPLSESDKRSRWR